jgi:hypothetical protein
MLKAIINTTFYVRGNPRTSYHSFPVYSEEIEKTLIRQLEFLQRHGSEYSLEFKIVKNNS